MIPSHIFKDLLVVELASVLAGPAVGQFFAELGARVIKVENKKTGGDVTRSWKLPTENPNQAYSAYYHSINWNKETHLLDLRSESDRAQVLNWIQKADLVVANFKAGSDKKLGFDYEHLKVQNPRLIYASISAYGPDDPRPGFDAMIQAETGWIYMNGDPEGPPVKMPVALMDILAAHQLKQGVLVALLQREKTGKGSRVDVSLFDTGVASLANQASNWLNVGQLPERTGSQHPNIAPYGDIFYTRDQYPIILGTGTQRQFEALCDILDLPSLKQDSRYATNPRRLVNRVLLNQQLETAFSQLDWETLKDRSTAQGVTLAPVNNLEAVFKLPAAQKLILEEQKDDQSHSKRVRTVVFRLQV
ncbi:MAG: CaiB/BaiF CoA-transferase family protein [Bacteroidota bacterium]